VGGKGGGVLDRGEAVGGKGGAIDDAGRWMIEDRALAFLKVGYAYDDSREPG